MLFKMPVMGYRYGDRHTLVEVRKMTEKDVAESKKVALCRLCDGDVAYEMKVLDDQGLCPTHSGELDMTEAEEDNLIRGIQNQIERSE